MKHTIIIGHTGQDGQILWNQLVQRGRSIIGINRSEIRIHTCGEHFHETRYPPAEISRLLREFRIDEVYYLAAYHHSGQEEVPDELRLWLNSWDTHVDKFKTVLDAVRKDAPTARVFYASSSRIFGESSSPIQDETTQWLPNCTYGTTKSAGMLVAGHYRRVHGMHVSCGILYNHESPLRGKNFVSKRIVNGLVSVKRGEANSFQVGSLGTRVDWGYAPDYTRAMELMLQLEEPCDLIIASGKTHSIQDFIAKAASLLGLEWKEFVFEEPRLLRRPSQELCGDPAALKKKTGWSPSVTFDEMVTILVGSVL